MSIEFITEDTVVDFVKKSDVVILDFTAAWCGPCKAQGIILKDVSEEVSPPVLIGKVDVDAPENRNLVSTLKIDAMPTMVFFVSGHIVAFRGKESGGG